MKSRILGVIIAFTLVFTASSAAVAQSTGDGDTGFVTVTLTDTGVFTVAIADATLTGATVTAGTVSSLSTGSLNITYTDTKTYRGGFFLTLNASNFASQTLLTPRPYQTLPAGVPYVIPASNFVVVRNYNVIQGRFSFGSWNTLGYAIGDIGATPSGIFPSLGGTTGNFDVGTGGPNAYHNWTAAESNALNTTPKVSRGLPGPGTAGPDVPTGSTHKLDVELTIPAGQPADVYKSTLTITVIPASL